MNINTIWVTLIYLLIGYLLGSISWSVILTKKVKKEDIREKGSGNAGATNTLREYGKKLALGVFTLDVLKTIISVLCAYLLSKFAKGPFEDGIIQVAGLGTIIGHIYPIFFKFKGGKGSASLVGLFISMNWILFFIGVVLFLLIVKKTRYVSLGSLVTPFILINFMILFDYVIPHMNDLWSNPILQGPYIWMNLLVITIAWLFTVFRHRKNINRLFDGSERKLGTK